jgi:hypothetical protein
MLLFSKFVTLSLKFFMYLKLFQVQNIFGFSKVYPYLGLGDLNLLSVILVIILKGVSSDFKQFL